MDSSVKTTCVKNFAQQCDYFGADNCIYLASKNLKESL